MLLSTFFFCVRIPVTFRSLLSGMSLVRALLLQMGNYLSEILELFNLVKNTALYCEKNPPGTHQIG
jgi:hypothetical protein